MDLCLYTDSVADLSFEAALDLAAEVGLPVDRDRRRRPVPGAAPSTR